ncbi:hypothetical protein [Vibrio sp. 1942]|uniref:hypothetical protein n=1 Tax=Vibrio sp. 1942 TaxID=3074583 RepID=UPI0029641801|nr:hypothetical protein [Vibrio sp. 1942]MDW2160214.1 hypothetical protein [Vibrio sp. 1942]
MGFIANVKTQSGREEPLYLRINHIIETNHGEPLQFVLRGFLSRDIYIQGGSYEYEKIYELPFESYDTDRPIREQCYEFSKNDHVIIYDMIAD